MGVHRLPGGREVFLVQFRMSGTYSGHMEGSPETISRHIREDLPGWAARRAHAGRLALVEPPPGTLPGWVCVGLFESRDGVRQTGADYNSRLTVCWFMADTARSLDAVIDSVLPHVDWDGLAEDYDVTDF